MEKTQFEIDLGEWEYLPDHGFLEDSDKKKVLSAGKRGSANSSGTVFDMNYFMCPSPTCEKIVEPSSERFSSRRVGGHHQQVVPVPIQLEPRFFKNNDNPDDDDDDEMTKNIILMTENKKMMMMMVNKDPDFGSVESNQDAVSQVFFKKMKENEFVDMKMDSPRSPTSRNIMPPPPQLDAAAFNFDDDKPTEAMDSINSCSPRNKIMDSDKEEIVDWEENNGGFDLWKWSLTGIGAICSFGVAAATVCIIIFGSQQRNKQQQQQQQKLRFQIYADDKRIKQVVQQATKLNEAISAVRGVPITRAHITYGGYYDSL